MKLSPLALALLWALAAPVAAAGPVATENGKKPPAKRLDPVLVVASRVPEPQQQAIAAVSRLDRDALELRGVQGIEALAQQLPGVEVVSDGHRFAAQGFVLRGLDGNRVSMELDGIPLPDGFGVGQFALAGRDLVELGIVDRVEVLRGPASTLYGSKALAGVVAYWTPDPGDAVALDDGRRWLSQSRLVTSSRDQSLALATRGLWRSVDGRSSALVAWARRDGHETENAADDPAFASNPADVRHDSVLAKFVRDAGTAGVWEATLERGEGRRQTDVQSLLFGPGRFSTTYALSGDDRYRRDRLSLDGQWSQLGMLSGLQLLLYAQDSESDQWSDQYRLAERATPFPSQRERRFWFEQASLGMELTAQWRGELAGFTHWQVFGVDIARHRYRGLREGVETNLTTGARSPVILGEVFPLRDFPNSVADEVGVFWQDEIRLAEHWALLPGIRWERYRLDARPDAIWREDNPDLQPVSLVHSASTPKLGLRWQRDSMTVYAQFSRGFRAPPFADVNIGLNLPTFNYVALPNPELRPERSRGVEAGLRWQGESLQASLALYDNRYTDLIDSRANLGRNSDGQLVFQSVNRARASIRGVEIELRTWLDRFGASGWYVDALASAARGEDDVSQRPLNSVPPHRAALATGFAASDGRWGGELRLTGVRRVTRADPSAGALFLPPGYASWDAHAWWEPTPRLRLNLSLFNLGDRRYWDWSALRGLPANAPDLDFYSRPGRSASLSLRIEL